MYTTSQHEDPAQPAAAAAAAPPAAQPAEEPAANFAEAEEIIEEDWPSVLGTGGVVSVTASATGLPKDDSSYPKEDDEEHYYK